MSIEYLKFNVEENNRREGKGWRYTEKEKEEAIERVRAEAAGKSKKEIEAEWRKP